MRLFFELQLHVQLQLFDVRRFHTLRLARRVLPRRHLFGDGAAFSAQLDGEKMDSELFSDSRKVRLVPLYLITEGDGTVLQTQEASIRISGTTAKFVVSRVFPLLDGTRTASEVTADLGSDLSGNECGRVLEMLHEHGLLSFEDAVPTVLPRASAPYFESLRRFLAASDRGGWSGLSQLLGARVVVVNPSPVVAALVRDLAYMGIGNVTLVGDSDIGIEDVQQSTSLVASDVGRPWADVLGERYVRWRKVTQLTSVAMPTSAIAWRDCIRGSTVVVASVSGPTYFHPWIKQLNIASLATNVTWLLLGNIQKFGITVGPTMVPHSTACAHCFEVRLKGNLAELETFDRLERHIAGDGPSVDFGSFAPANEIAGHLCSMEVRDVILRERIAQTVGNMLLVDVNNYEISTHAVLRLPRCPACSDVGSKPVTRAWA